jgi:PAS domain S-box-containing protein
LRVLVGWKEIAAYLNCSVSTAGRRVADGLPVFRVGGGVRAFAADIDKWLEGERLRKMGESESPAASGESSCLVVDETNLVDALSALTRDQGDRKYAVLPLGVDTSEFERIERRLASAEENYRWLVETVPAWIWELDAAGEYKYSNVASLDLLGYRPEEVIGFKPGEFLIAPEDVEKWEQQRRNLHDNKKVVRDFQCRFLHRDGGARRLETDAEPAFGASGAVAGIRGVSRDVTARVRAEEKEKEHLATLSFLSETATGFVGFEPEGDLFAYVAEKLRELVGDASVALTSFEETADTYTVRATANLGAKTGAILKALGKNPVGMAFPATGVLRTALLEGKLRKYAVPLHELTSGIISKRVTRKLQDLLGFGDIYVMGIVRHGKLLGVASIIPPRGVELRNPEVVEAFINQAAVAIQRKYAEEALRESEEKFRSLVERSNDGIAIVVDGRIAYSNPRISEATGYAAQDLLDEPFGHFVDPEDLPKVSTYYEKRMRGEEVPTVYEIAARRKDGSKLYVELNVGTVSYRGQIAELVFIRDLTERRRALELTHLQHELAQGLAAAASLEEAARLCVQAALRASGLDSGGMYAVDVEAGTGELIYHEGLGKKFIEAASRYEKMSPHAQLVLEGKPRFTAYEDLGVPVTAIQAREGLRAVGVVPITHEGKAVACLNVASHTAKEIEPWAQEALQAIAAQVGGALARIRAEEMFRESGEKFRSIIESTPMGMHMYELTADGRLVFIGANPAADEILGVDNSQFVSKTIEEAFPPLANTEVPEKYRRAAAHGERWYAEQIDYEDEQIRGAFDVTAFQTSPGKMAALFLDITERKRAEEALRESEREFRAVFDNARDAIFWADPETGFIIECNKAAETMLERERDEIVGNHQSKLHPPQKADYYSEMFQQHIERKRAVGVEAEVVTKSGKEIPVEITASVTLVGEKPIIQGIFRDVTERQRAAEALRESEEKYHSLADNVPVGIFRSTAERGGRLLSVNPALAQMFGYETPEDMAKTRVADFYADREDRKKFIDTVGSAGVVADYEVRFKRADGGTFLGSLNARAVKGPDGDVAYVDGVLEDITERKRAEEALRESEGKYRNLFHGSKDAIFIHDLEGNIFDANEQVSALFGYTTEETVSLRVPDLHPPEALSASREAFAEISRTGVVRFEIDFKRKDGSAFPAEVSSSLFEIGGEKVIQGIVRDITERKRAEEALRESEREIRRAEGEKAAILSSMVEHVVHHDADLKILWANEAAAASVAASPESLVGRYCYELWRGRQEQCPGCPVAAALETGGVHEGEVQTPDGRVWFVRGYAVQDEAGNVTSAVEVTLEITERKRAEEALRQTLAENEALLEAVPDLMFVIDKEGNYVDFKRAEADLFALPPESIVGKNVRDTGFSAADEKEIFARLEETLGTGETTTVEYTLQTPRGPGSYEARMTKLNDDKVLVVVREITEHKEAEEALRREKRFSESLMSSLPGVFYVFDAEGRFRWWNKNLETVTGYSAGEVARMRPPDFFRGRDKEVITERIARAFSDGYATAEARLHTKDGAEIPYFFTGKRVEIHGKTYLMGMGVDLAELARAEETQEKKE